MIQLKIFKQLLELGRSASRDAGANAQRQINILLALWLGHESIKTTQVYLNAHLALKEAALAKVKPFDGPKGGRYKPSDRLLAFLDGL